MLRVNLPGSLKTKKIILFILTLIILGILFVEFKNNSQESTIPSPLKNQSITSPK
ncbi:MAG: hypothetical protein ACRC2K_04585 [Clostridium sp.]